VYCLAERTRMPTFEATARGIPGSGTPRAVEISPTLWAVISDVPLARYSADRLESQLHDINWVANIGVRHEAVIEQVAALRGTTVLPMKLFTMFSSLERALGDLRARRRDIAAILRRVRGCQEWGVRVTRNAPASAPRRAAGVPSSGTAFLAAKKRVRDEARESLVRSSNAAEAAFASLSAHARDAVRRDAPSGAATPPLVDAAFLVTTASRSRFRAAATRAAAACRTAGARLSVTGPWPPYNFVSASEPR
jgi:hypothetical protein